MSLNGPITIMDAEGRVLRIIPVAVAIAEREQNDAQRKQREAIAATIAKARKTQRDRST